MIIFLCAHDDTVRNRFGGYIVLTHKSPVKTGIVIKAALLGGGAGRNAALHEELGVKHTLGQDVLVDRNIGVGLEVMQKGIFADKKLFGQHVKGQWFCDMRVDVPDDFVDPVRLFCADSILSLNDAAYFQGEIVHTQALHFPGIWIIGRFIFQVGINHPEKFIPVLFTNVITIFLFQDSVFQNIEQTNLFSAEIEKCLPGNIKIGALIIFVCIYKMSAVLYARRENKQVHWTRVKRIILNQDLDIPGQEKVELVMRMHVKFRHKPFIVKTVGGSEIVSFEDIVGFNPVYIFHDELSPKHTKIGTVDGLHGTATFTINQARSSIANQRWVMYYLCN